MFRPKNLILLTIICLLTLGGQQREIDWPEQFAANSASVADIMEQKVSERQDLVIFQDVVPNIIGLPVEYSSRGKEEQNNFMRIIGRNHNVQHDILPPEKNLYLVISRYIEPGLASSQIGFPFHYFF